MLQIHLAYFSFLQYEKLQCPSKVPLPLADLIRDKLVLVCPIQYLLPSIENTWKPFSPSEHVKMRQNETN